MFIKVMFGAGSFVLVNTSCRLVNLTAHLRQKAGLLPDVTLALLAEDGKLVSLEEDLKEAASGAPTMGSSLLKERATYVLVRIISKRERAWPPPAMSPYWRTWMTTTQSWQRNCAGWQASPLRAMTGGSAWALGVATMSKALLQDPERVRCTWDYLLMSLHTTLDCPGHLSCATHGADGNRAPPPHPGP
ncbi:uncharacterized protein C22orf15 homolog isoform X5 [Sapajus apella]|uniref:Uncharacterized protein C22orf15 homolog isoform X5 n=2 Tax=Sapajus apella TaxID=9515 RepID=A0A6J3G3W6_SAPAP|nr:uncharacterized protein C22orf15 homolog isoform X5 [Sapajus apella]